MLDIALALSNGATLLTVGQVVRLAPEQLLNVLFPSSSYLMPHHLKCSIMQTTPSLLMRWTSQEIAERVLSSTSSLRILALGGEAFPPIDTVAQWQNWNCRYPKRLFNLYGLSEMSCWATAYEISSDDVISKREIAIGEPLDELTRFGLTSDGELLLKTNVRKCFQSVISDEEVLNHDEEFTLRTGDVFYKRNDDQLVFKGRINGVVKVFGRKVDLNYLETISSSVDNVRQSCAVYETARHIIIIFVVANVKETEPVKRRIKRALLAKNVDVACEIYCIGQMPLSSHGKISKSMLLQNFNSQIVPDKSSETCSEMFLRLLNDTLCASVTHTTQEKDGISAKRSRTSIDSSFLTLGGTSLKAMHILNEMEQQFRVLAFPHLLPMMLDDTVSIGAIIEDLEKSEEHPKEVVPFPSNAVINQETINRKEVWSIDMKKCIDATPSLLSLDQTKIISVGSHSKLLYNVRAIDGFLISSIELPDRIESQVTQFGTKHAMVGCYDGYLYCFDIATGEVKWKFDSGGMIKSKVLLINDLAIFGNYSDANNLWCVNAVSGTLCWSKRLGTKSIYSSAVRVRGCETDFIICTLDGMMSRLDAIDGTIKWTSEIGIPFFSTPLIVKSPQRDFIISAAVNGCIECCDGARNRIWSHRIHGNVFTSFDCCVNSEQKTVVDVIFGSHNHHLYCLAFDMQADVCSQRWKCKTMAPIRATPCFLQFRNEKFILCCSTNGDVNIICRLSGVIRQRFNVDGEIFSTPTIDENFVFIGSRNNRLYCFDLN